MDKEIEILANLSPLIVLFCLLAIFLTIFLETKKYMVFFTVFVVNVFAFVSSLYKYAKPASVILFYLILALFFLFMSYMLFAERETMFDVVLSFAALIFVFKLIYMMNGALIEIKFFGLKQVVEFAFDCVNRFLELINNDWVKGISIAAVGGVISALISGKIKNRKK